MKETTIFLDSILVSMFLLVWECHLCVFFVCRDGVRSGFDNMKVSQEASRAMDACLPAASITVIE